MKELYNENSTKAKATRGNVYTVNTTQKHTNKYIKHDPSKSTTTSTREKEIDKSANA